MCETCLSLRLELSLGLCVCQLLGLRFPLGLGLCCRIDKTNPVIYIYAGKYGVSAWEMWVKMRECVRDLPPPPLCPWPLWQRALPSAPHHASLCSWVCSDRLRPLRRRRLAPFFEKLRRRRIRSCMRKMERNIWWNYIWGENRLFDEGRLGTLALSPFLLGVLPQKDVSAT